MIHPFKNNQIFRFIGWFFLVNSLVFLFFGVDYLRAILTSGTLFNNSVVDFSKFYLGKMLVVLFVLVTYLTYMMLLAYIPAVLVFLLACVTSSKRLIGFFSVLIATISVICFIVDSHVYSMFNFHINRTILSFVFSPQWRGVFDFSQYELFLMMAAIVAFVIIESCIAWVVWKKIILVGCWKIGRQIFVLWLGGVLFSYFTLMLSIAKQNNLFAQQSSTLPLFNQLVSYVIPDDDAINILSRYGEQFYAQPGFANAPLHYPLRPLRCGFPNKPYNIILIMVDSLRFDSLQLKYMPKVSQFGKKSWRFQKHMSGGNATQPGLFSLFYSIPSNYWTAALEQKRPPVLMDLLVKYGYAIEIFWSMDMLNPPFHKTIYAGLQHLALTGAPGSDIGNGDRYITNKAIEFLISKKHKEPFFLHLFYDAPHGYCSYQSFATPFQPTSQQCSRLSMKNDDDKLPYLNRYLNAVKFDDDEIAKVLDTIEDKGFLKNSIVIFTSDHGQEFNDNHLNYWGHSGNFSASQVHVPFIMSWLGEKPREINYLTSGYDLVPTLLTRLFSCKNPISDYSIGQNLLVDDERLPFILAGSYINMGIIEPDRLTILERSGRFSITDPHMAPLPLAKPREGVTHQAMVLMRKYF